MYKLLFPVLLVLVLISRAGAQQFAFPESAAEDPATLSKAIVRLAGQALAVYKERSREISQQPVCVASGSGPVP